MFIRITGKQRQVLISTCMYLGQMVSGFTISWTGSIIQKLRDTDQSPLSFSLSEAETSLLASIIYFGSILVYLGQIVLGFMISWTGTAIQKIRDLEESPLPYLLSDTEISLIASVIFFGGFLGPFLTGWLSNIKGRRPCLILGGVSTGVACAILATARNLAMLYCGRILAGIGIGVINVMNVVYIGEIASTNIRGILLTAVGIFTTVGTTILFTVGYFLSYSGTTFVGLGLCIAFTGSALMIPETPIFFILKDNDDNVTKILEKLDRLEDLDKLLASKKEIKETTSKKDWIDLFKLKSNRKALIIVVTASMLQHASGIMAVMFFSSTIFTMAGSSIDPNISMIIIGCFQLLGSSITPFFIERMGRKYLLATSSGVCSFSMFLLGFYFYFDHLGSSIIDNIKWFPLLILIIFFIGYDFGLGIIPSTLIGEMFTANVRSKGSSLAMTLSWVVGFIVTTVFGSVIEKVGAYGAFWFFGCTCGFTLVFTLLFVPETKGKSLLEIQEILGK